MEEKIVTTNSINEKLVIDKYLLFKWKCEEKKYIGNKVVVRFSRDDSLPYIEELRKLEAEYGEFKIPSMLPTIIPPIIAIVLFTVFLVIFLVQRDNFNLLLYFLTLALPAIICVLLAVLFMSLRMMTFKKIEREKPEKDQEFLKRVSQLVK